MSEKVKNFCCVVKKRPDWHSGDFDQKKGYRLHVDALLIVVAK